MKRLLPALLLLSCTTEPDPIKKASFVLKEACESGQIVFNPEPPPTLWEAYYVRGSLRTTAEITYRNGFQYPCNQTDSGTLEIFYQ
jgi:hypothetical protein